MAEEYKSKGEQTLAELTKMRLESHELKRELARLRDDFNVKRSEIAAINDKLYKADCEIREIKSNAVGNDDRSRQEKQVRDWENTCEDLAKELKYV